MASTKKSGLALSTPAHNFSFETAKRLFFHQHPQCDPGSMPFFNSTKLFRVGVFASSALGNMRRPRGKTAKAISACLTIFQKKVSPSLHFFRRILKALCFTRSQKKAMYKVLLSTRSLRSCSVKSRFIAQVCKCSVRSKRPLFPAFHLGGSSEVYFR